MIETCPVGLRVRGREVLVVGAGPIAARKAESLAAQGAKVHVVAPEHSPEMDAVSTARRSVRCYESSDLADVWFVVTATGIPAVDHQVYADATEQRLWCNAADDPQNCSVILPAVVRKGDLTISISTGGTSPATASWLRRRIETLLDEGALPVLAAAVAVRRRVRGAGLGTEVPGWAEVLDNEALALVAHTPLDSEGISALEQRLLVEVAPQLARTG